MSHENASLPLAAQYAISAAIGKDYSDYHAVNKGEGWAFANPANQLTAHLRSDDVGVFIDDDEWTMRLERLGYDSELMPVASAHIQVQENRIEYDHGVIKAWYVHGPLGLQQGFTLLERPATSAHHTDTLTVTLGLGGSLRPET